MTKTPTPEELFGSRAKEFNNLVPSPDLLRDLPEGVKVRLALVWVDPDPAVREIYKSGQLNDGSWTKTYSLGKAALYKILGAAGGNAETESIQDIPGKPDVKQAKVRVEVRTMDGDWRSFPGSFDMDMPSEVAAFRAKLELELREEGHIERDQWEGPRDNRKKVKKTYAGEAAMKIIDREVADFDGRLRKYSGAMVETKAILRATKGILAIKDGYTLDELKRPFVVHRYQHPRLATPAEIASQVFPRHGNPTPPPQPPSSREARAESDGSHPQASGSHPEGSRDPGKPGIVERINMLKDPESSGGLTSEQIVELAKEICEKKNMPLFSEDPGVLKPFILGMEAQLQ